MHRRGTAAMLTVSLIFAYAAGCNTMGSGTQATAAATETMSTLIEKVVQDPQYMASCRAAYASAASQQAGFSGILPGTDTAASVLRKVGAPNQVSDGVPLEWYYDGFLVYFRNDTVERLYVDGAAYLETTLREIVSQYGCPDLIFGMDTAEEGTGSYSAAEFLYNRLGVSMFFATLPVPLDGRPKVAEYFQPGPLRSIVERFNFQNYTPQTGFPLDWPEAVQE